MNAAPAASAVLRPRTEPGQAARLARSAAVTGEGHQMRTADVPGWIESRERTHRFTVSRVPLAELDGWSAAPGTGNLVHRSGRFFAVAGLAATLDEGPVREWQQPVIHQPEVGILGILAKEFDGVLHFLLQAKMEPGNPRPLQLSPTVQATRSNYTGVHRGARVKYLGHFAGEQRGRVLADSLQSEHGAWFYRKANRNMLVETHDRVAEDDDFRWLTLGQIGELLRRDNLVNMDTRTVLSCFPLAAPGHPADAADQAGAALCSDTGLRSWFTEERARRELTVRRIPLAEVAGWDRGPDVIARPDGRYFRICGVSVTAGNREVGGWDQPLLAPVGRGVTAFLYRRFDGVPHLLAQAKAEPGHLRTVELAPTVQCTPGNWAHLPPRDRPPFLDAVLSAPRERVRYAAVHSEEGGRFLEAESRCLFVEADDATAPVVPPRGYQWLTPAQLSSLAQHGHDVNVQARTLLACLNSGAARLT